LVVGCWLLAVLVVLITMVNSYIGRLVLIYGFALSVLMVTVYLYYDDWLEPQFSHLESVVVADCKICSYKDQFQKQGLLELTNTLNAREKNIGLKYTVSKEGTVTAGNLRFDKYGNNFPEQEVPLTKQIIGQDNDAGTFISAIALDDFYILYLEEYLSVKREIVLSNISPQVLRESLLGITSKMLLFGVFLLFCGFIATTIITYKIHLKLKNINKTTKHIIEHQDLGQRITHSEGNNEFDQLAINLNKMLGKIEAKVEDVKQISNNIAHDLRTPLTSLHNKIEDLKLDSSIVLELTDHINQILDTFNALLRISHLESGNANIQLQKIDLKTLVADVVDLYLPLAEEKNQVISVTLELSAIKADINLLFRALANLLENAIKYTPSNTSIQIISLRQNGQVIITVQDEGDGIPEGKLEDVIQRFVRLDETRNSPGNGLGLSTVKAIVEAHRGNLFLTNISEGFSAAISIPS
jgi:signal transduction histidine kinase